MRILFVTGEYPPMQGGVGDYTAKLARALRSVGEEVIVLTSQRAQPKSGISLASEQVLPVIGSWGTGCWRRILAVARQWRVDVVHVQYQTAAFGMSPAINGLPLAARLWSRRPRVVVTFHDLKPPYLFPKAGPLRKLPALLLASTADAVVVTNVEDAAALRAWLRLDVAPSGDTRSQRLYSIPIGSNINPMPPPSPAEIEEWRAQLGLDPSALLLSFFGFLNQTKGIDVLLDAIASLARRHWPVYLLMVGGTAGDSDPTNRAFAHQIRGKADSLALRGRVFWTGFTRSEEVSLNLQRTDVCVLPFLEGGSYRHGTLVAALAHGLPVITTAAPASAPVAGLDSGWPRLAHLENCYLVPPGDVTQVMEAIETLMEKRDLRARLAQGARTLAPFFRWERIAEATASLYRELLQ